MLYKDECLLINLTSYYFILLNIKKINKIKYYYSIEKIYPFNLLGKIKKTQNNIKLFIIKKINKDIVRYSIDDYKLYSLNWKSNKIAVRFLNRDIINISKYYFYKSLNEYFSSNALSNYYKHRIANDLSCIIFERLILNNFFRIYKKEQKKNYIIFINFFNRIILTLLIIAYILYPFFFFIKKIRNIRFRNKKYTTQILHPLIKSFTENRNRKKINYLEDEYNFFSLYFDKKKFLFYKNTIWQTHVSNKNNIINKNDLTITPVLILNFLCKHIFSSYYLLLSLFKNEKFYFVLFNFFALKEILDKKIELQNISYNYEVIRDDYRANHILRYLLNLRNKRKSIIVQHHIFPNEYPSIVFAKSDVFLGISKFHEIIFKKFYKNILPVTRINNFSSRNDMIKENTIVLYLPSLRKLSGIINQFDNFFNSLIYLLKTKSLNNYKIIIKVKNLSQFKINIDDEFKPFFDKISQLVESNKQIKLEDSSSVSNELLYTKHRYQIVFGPSFTVWELAALNELIYLYPIKGFENEFFKDYKNIILIESFKDFFENFLKVQLKETDILNNLNYDKSSTNFKTFFGKIINE